MECVTFGEFELDPAAYELRRRGRAVHLERLAMEFLLLLAARPGELVTRAEIVDRLWGKDVFIDVDNAVNTLVRKLRQALNDSVERPRFLQTVTGKGYRFVATTKVSDHQDASGRFVLAVLPFRNLTGEAEREYLVDGFTEEAIALLGGLAPDQMAVVARTSIMTYKHTSKTIAAIARELGATFILEGSVRSEGDRLRVTVQLIHASDQTQVWGDSYDGSASNVIEVQQALCRTIAERVHLRLSPLRGSDVAHRHSVGPDAYDLYLRGRYFWNQRTGPAIRRAIEYFRRALVAAPGYALALAGLADAMSILPITADRPTRECLPDAKEAAESAVRYNDRCAEGHAALAACKFWMEWDWGGAAAAARRATALQPNYALGHMICGHILSNSGRHADAEEEIRHAVRLDPLSAHVRTIHAQLLFQARRWEEANTQVEQALVLNPDSWIAHIVRGRLLIQAGRLSEAHEALQRAFDLSAGNTEALSLRGYVYAASNDIGRALRVAGTLEEMSLHRYVPPYNVALIHAGLNDVEAAVRYLEKAYEDRDVRMVFLGVDPKWSDLAGDARVQALFPSRFARRGSPDLRASNES